MKFTFVVITFNHEKYILEHLESIKFQIEEYGIGKDFQLIIADDGSRDRTIELARFWLSKNQDLFCCSSILADGTNKGTCYNYTKSWDEIEGEYCKITAGDDVYSSENLFEDLGMLDDHEMVSGIPLLLYDEQLSFSGSLAFHIIATDYIYRGKSFLERMRKISVSNTPNLILPLKVYQDRDFLNFIRDYSVTEDYPLHIKMSEKYNPLRIIQLHKVFVYYRRTENSTYRIKRSKFDSDKIKLFSYLKNNTKNVFDRMLLANRISCYKMHNRLFARLLNINYYVYLFSVLHHLSRIIRDYRTLKLNMGQYQAHMDLIRLRASGYAEEFIG